MIGVYLIELPEGCTDISECTINAKMYWNDECMYMAENDKFTSILPNEIAMIPNARGDTKSYSHLVQYTYACGFNTCRNMTMGKQIREGEEK